MGDVMPPQSNKSVSSDEMLFKNQGLLTPTLQEMYRRVNLSLEKGLFPISLGGDHSMSIASVASVANSHGKVGLVWIDAHGDINTPGTSPSGNLHGMSVAALLGMIPELKSFSCIRPENVVYIGARDLDEGEVRHIADLGIRCYSVEQLNRLGVERIAEDTIARCCDGTSGFVTSFDLDALDPEFAPGVGTPVANGINTKQALSLTRLFASSKRLKSFEVVELNPELDVDGKTGAIALSLLEALVQGRYNG